MHRTVKVEAAQGKHGSLFIFAVPFIETPTMTLPCTLAEGESYEHSNRAACSQA